ncbi:hypothetical protein O6H91_18G015900 [Diphasiastrum complanatum]|uniref:Uncharacterized protein n=2 Tax=Diphasiastrum complanatum TaxID=34168 RepID=A0ACC2AYC0_DIPCM|nr:hypothetical protein O6H91_18G015900 [Diphasiastrum complanatum]KAJ7522539.1 hypothetical protein O6H91_18G015900 [Diphasiastrum complanatum]
MERSLEGWEGVQRQGQDLADRFTLLAQGLGCMLQSHIRTPGTFCNSPAAVDVSSQPSAAENSLQGESEPLLKWRWPWVKCRKFNGRMDRVGAGGKREHASGGASREEALEASSGIQELGHRLGQAGAELGACVGELVGHVVKQCSKPAIGNAATQFKSQSSPLIVNENQQGRELEWREPNKDVQEQGLISRQARRENGLPVSSSHSERVDVSNEEFFAILANSNGKISKQSSITVTTMYDSRTQDIESSVVARGDLWRAEASHGGSSSGSGSPLFMLQVGPVLLVRDSTLLLPVHLSKQHLLWYGFDRKNGLHSLCPAIWSKQRKWLLMSMISLNSLRCSFMDLQCPNGQLTYVAGEGFTGNAFMPAFGGVLQAQGRLPGEARLSFSYKNKLGTRLSPSLLLPERSFSLGVVQPLSWQRSGLMLRPTVQLSVTPTLGGRYPGWRAEVIHLPTEKLSWGCGCSFTLEPCAFASISLGRSKRNGEYTGSSGVVLQVETPLENLRRTSVNIQLNSSIEF